MRRGHAGALAVALLLAGPPALASAPAPESCEAQLAATNDLRDGQPLLATPGDGAVFSVRSGGRDRLQKLYRYDLGTGRETLLDDASGGGALTVAEAARRQRARITSGGITEFSLSKDRRRLLVSLAGGLTVMDQDGSHRTALPGTGWIGATFSPDGRLVASVRDDDLHVLDPATGRDVALTTGGTALVTHGLAEFAAEEELDRFDGFWWSPDGRRLLVETADSTGVEPHFIADPGHPERRPVEFRYPRAGTANAVVSLAIVDRARPGPPIPVAWDRDAFPYLGRVAWPAHGPLTLVVLNRAQTDLRVLAADPATGATRTLLDEHDPAWIDLTPSIMRRGPLVLPHWLDDGAHFLWASERSGDWRLELHRADGSLDHAVTPDGFRFNALLDLDPRTGDVTVSGSTEATSERLYRIPLAGGRAIPLATADGVHEGAFGDQHAVLVDRQDLADGTDDAVVRDAADGHVIATLPSSAERPVDPVRVAWTTAGSGGFDTAIVLPHAPAGGRRLPVVLSVYAGPGVKVVMHAARRFAAEQCLADRGAAVVSLDGRGTPNHGRAFERAIKSDLIDIPLADQASGLASLLAAHPGWDPKRVAVMGWSFGGYFSAMATIRRPDLFAAGVAGAPPVDWQDYDTAYTERYLGLPQAAPDAYRVSDVLTYAPKLARPLLIVHGLTDDNVYFVNTVRLTDALLRAGKPYELLLLPGTHLLADPALKRAEAERVDEFLARTIGLVGPSR